MALSPSILATLDDLADRHEELSALLGEADVVADRDKFTALSREYSELEPIIERYRRIATLRTQIDEAQVLLKDDDAEMRQLASDDRDQSARAASTRSSSRSRRCSCRRIRTTTQTCFSRFAPAPAATRRRSSPATCSGCIRDMPKTSGWQLEILNERPGEHGGFKEIISRIEGERVYSQLKFESGVHRVQRVPQTESQGRIHTSACTVAILPEAGRGRRRRHPEERSAHRHVSFVRRGRTARQQDRLGRTPDAHSNRTRRRMSGRTLAAQEPRPSDVVAEGAICSTWRSRSSSRTSPVAQV